jgi:hypothetical protein
LTVPYPPPKHIILERPDLPIPSEPELKDRTCGYCSDFHIFDVTKLSKTLDHDQLALFLDAET